MSARVHQHAALQHNAIFYNAPADLTTAAERFVREGLEAGEVVLVNSGSNPVTEALSAVYGDEKRVVFAESPVYGRPVSVIDAYQRIMDRGLAAGVPGYRAMGFIDFDNTDLPWQEWLLYEAAVNRVFADYPFRTLCPYDTTEVEPGILEAIRCTHTGLVTPHGVRPNPGYLDPADLVRHEGWSTPRAAVQDDPPHLVLDRTENLTELRLELFPATLMSAVPRQKVDDFVTAVCEVTANAWRHGAPPVRLRLWTEVDTLLCTVTDQGPGIDDAFVGYARPSSTEASLGLWAARQLCDVLDFDRTRDGFEVRLVAYA